MTTLRMTNGTEVFSVTVDRQDDLGPAQAFDSRGGRYDRDDYNGGWTSDAADESVTIIADDESDEDAKTRLLAEVERVARAEGKKMTQTQIMQGFELGVLQADGEDIVVLSSLRPEEPAAITYAMRGQYRGVSGTIARFGGVDMYMRWAPLTEAEREQYATARALAEAADYLHYTGRELSA